MDLNGPLGLEHGFTIAALPRCAETDELRLALGFGRAVSIRDEGQSLALQTSSGEILRYGQLFAYDANGDHPQASLATTEDGAELRVDARRAALPLVIDPLIWRVERAKLVASDGAQGDPFGSSVRLSGDG